jgi:hypothetical protein
MIWAIHIAPKPIRQMRSNSCGIVVSLSLPKPITPDSSKSSYAQRSILTGARNQWDIPGTPGRIHPIGSH